MKRVGCFSGKFKSSRLKTTTIDQFVDQLPSSRAANLCAACAVYDKRRKHNSPHLLVNKLLKKTGRSCRLFLSVRWLPDWLNGKNSQRRQWQRFSYTLPCSHEHKNYISHKQSGKRKKRILTRFNAARLRQKQIQKWFAYS